MNHEYTTVELNHLTMKVVSECAGKPPCAVINACAIAIREAVSACDQATDALVCMAILNVSIGEILQERFHSKPMKPNGDIEFDINELRGGL